MNIYSGFLLTRQWRDTSAGIELEFWLSTPQGPLQLRVTGQQAVFFLPLSQQQQAEAILADSGGWQLAGVELRDFSMQPVVACYFQSQKQLRQVRDLLFARGLEPLEADISPADRFLMERYIRGGIRCRGRSTTQKHSLRLVSDEVAADSFKPVLKVVSLDIETAMQGLQLFSIAIYSESNGEIHKTVFMVSEEAVPGVTAIFPDQKQLLLAFLKWVESDDPDIIIGWNVVNFDMWFLQQLCQRYNIPFTLGRAGARVHWRTLDDDGQRRAISVPGRVVLDGIEVLKAATYQFESFSLNAVAGAVLGDAKLIVGEDRGEKITALYDEDKPALARYNVQDCKLVWDIFQRLDLLEFAIARTQMTGLPLDRIGGSVAAFEFRYLPLLHRAGFVAPNAHLRETVEASPGGFVMNSRPGLYRHVLVLDFKSLYPSIIRSFRIDPLGMVYGLLAELDQAQLVPGFNGAWFAKDKAILPGLIEELWSLRDSAKSAGNKALSQAIKILMNSFYGVLGAKGCRFFDSRLASSITRRGHQIIQQTAEQIESMGWPVIYGDTDSVFVWLNSVSGDDEAEAIGRRLQQDLNQWWTQRLRREYRIDSALELEFETHFQRFLMPTVRGSDTGSKKRYAGIVSGDNGESQLVFKGLETVRSDWTPLAREFQAELYRRIFHDLPYKDYVVDTVARVLAGELDQKLLYRKRLRRRMQDYQRNIPPHVQAARKAQASLGIETRRGDWVEYVVTLSGAEPAVFRQKQVSSAAIDYQHYIDRQLAPVADGILGFVGDSFRQLTDQQISLSF